MSKGEPTKCVHTQTRMASAAAPRRAGRRAFLDDGDEEAKRTFFVLAASREEHAACVAKLCARLPAVRPASVRDLARPLPATVVVEDFLDDAMSVFHARRAALRRGLGATATLLAMGGGARGWVVHRGEGEGFSCVRRRAEGQGLDEFVNASA